MAFSLRSLFNTLPLVQPCAAGLASAALPQQSAPLKRPATSFSLYVKDMHKQNGEGLSAAAVMKQAGVQWRQMDAQLKQKYEERAAAERAEFNSKKQRLTEQLPKRPPAAYQLFVKDEYQSSPQYKPGGTATLGELSKQCSAKWEKLSAQAKSTYEAQAQQLRQQYDAELKKLGISDEEASAYKTKLGMTVKKAKQTDHQLRQRYKVPKVPTLYRSWYSSKIEDMKQRHVGKSLGEINKLLSDQFSALQSSELQEAERAFVLAVQSYKKQFARVYNNMSKKSQVLLLLSDVEQQALKEFSQTQAS